MTEASPPSSLPIHNLTVPQQLLNLYSECSAVSSGPGFQPEHA